MSADPRRSPYQKDAVAPPPNTTTDDGVRPSNSNVQSIHHSSRSSSTSSSRRGSSDNSDDDNEAHRRHHQQQQHENVIEQHGTLNDTLHVEASPISRANVSSASPSRPLNDVRPVHLSFEGEIDEEFLSAPSIPTSVEQSYEVYFHHQMDKKIALQTRLAQVEVEESDEQLMREGQGKARGPSTGLFPESVEMSAAPPRSRTQILDELQELDKELFNITDPKVYAAAQSRRAWAAGDPLLISATTWNMAGKGFLSILKAEKRFFEQVVLPQFADGDSAGASSSSLPSAEAAKYGQFFELTTNRSSEDPIQRSPNHSTPTSNRSNITPVFIPSTFIPPNAHIIVLCTQEHGVNANINRANHEDLERLLLQTTLNEERRAKVRQANITTDTPFVPPWKYKVIGCETLWALRLVIFAREDVAGSIDYVYKGSCKTGALNGYLGNKGGVSVALTLFLKVPRGPTTSGPVDGTAERFGEAQTSSSSASAPNNNSSRSHRRHTAVPVSSVPLTLLFIGAHLTAHQKHIESRNRDYKRLVTQMELCPLKQSKVDFDAAATRRPPPMTTGEDGVVGPANGSDDRANSGTAIIPAAQQARQTKILGGAFLRAWKTLLMQEVPHCVVGVPSPLDSGSAASSPTSLPPSPSITAAAATDLSKVSPIFAPSGGRLHDLTDHFDYCVFLGDLNYRIEGTKTAIPRIITEHPALRAALSHNDQLIREMKKGLVFHDFQEGRLRFPPSYKFVKVPKPRSSKGLLPFLNSPSPPRQSFRPTTNDDSAQPTSCKRICYQRQYDASRIPAYCDRILWKSLANGATSRSALSPPVSCSAPKAPQGEMLEGNSLEALAHHPPTSEPLIRKPAMDAGSFLPPPPMELLMYRDVPEIGSSDHRPVFALLAVSTRTFCESHMTPSCPPTGTPEVMQACPRVAWPSTSPAASRRPLQGQSFSPLTEFCSTRLEQMAAALAQRFPRKSKEEILSQLWEFKREMDGSTSIAAKLCPSCCVRVEQGGDNEEDREGRQADSASVQRDSTTDNTTPKLRTVKSMAFIRRSPSTTELA